MLKTGATNTGGQCEFITAQTVSSISFITEVTDHSRMDKLVKILHVDLSKAADITSSDCSHEQSKEVQSG